MSKINAVEGELGKKDREGFWKLCFRRNCNDLEMGEMEILQLFWYPGRTDSLEKR